MILVYCDGACSGNGKENAVGGWAYTIIIEDDVITGMGSEVNTTNNRMELMAAINALRWVRQYNADSEIILRTDSAYIHNCYTQKWWINWRKNGWRNAKKEPVANKDLWEELILFFQDNKITFEKVKGHSGDKYNEIVDRLAVNAIKTYKTRKEENND